MVDKRDGSGTAALRPTTKRDWPHSATMDKTWRCGQLEWRCEAQGGRSAPYLSGGGGGVEEAAAL